MQTGLELTITDPRMHMPLRQREPDDGNEQQQQAEAPDLVAPHQAVPQSRGEGAPGLVPNHAGGSPASFRH